MYHALVVYVTRCKWNKDCRNLKTVIKMGDKINLSGVFQETSTRELGYSSYVDLFFQLSN